MLPMIRRVMSQAQRLLLQRFLVSKTNLKKIQTQSSIAKMNTNMAKVNPSMSKTLIIIQMKSRKMRYL